jgi:hypothetical protein
VSEVDEADRRFEAAVVRVVRGAATDVVDAGFAGPGGAPGSPRSSLFEADAPRRLRRQRVSGLSDVLHGPEAHCTEMRGSEQLRLRDSACPIDAVIRGASGCEHRQVKRWIPRPRNPDAPDGDAGVDDAGFKSAANDRPGTMSEVALRRAHAAPAISTSHSRRSDPSGSCRTSTTDKASGRALASPAANRTRRRARARSLPAGWNAL